MEPNKYNFYIGTARGTLICTKCDPNEKLNHQNADEPSESTSLIFGRTEDEIISGYQNGKVTIFSTLQNKYIKTITDLEGEGSVTGVGCVNKSIIVGRQDGIINIWNAKSNDFFDLGLYEKGSLLSMVYNTNRENVIGTGGEYNDFKLWNIETKDCIFKAKSLGHDELNLPIPTSVRGICYFPESEHLSACATKEGHVLLYDDRAQRRPVIKFFEKKASFTCISSAFRDRQCFAGTTKGYMLLLDMKAGKTLRTFTSFTGGITSIACDAVEPFVATTSLDRHLRVHNMNTKELVHKEYLKQNLTSLLMKPIVKDEPKEEKKDDTVVDEEYEEIFNNMETVDEGKNKKTKKKLIENSKEETFNNEEAVKEKSKKTKRKLIEHVKEETFNNEEVKEKNKKSKRKVTENGEERTKKKLKKKHKTIVKS